MAHLVMSALQHVHFWINSFHIWHKSSPAWEGVSHAMTFDLDLYLEGYLPVTSIFNGLLPSTLMGIVIVPCHDASGRPSVPLSVCVSILNDVTALTLRISAISLKFGGVMHSSRSLSKMAMLGWFLHIPQNFEIFHDRLGPGLGNDITSPTF